MSTPTNVLSLSRFSGLLVLSAALWSCAGGPAQVTPGTSAADARAVAGTPTEERRMADGTTAWYYGSGPCGRSTYRVHLDANGRVLESGQVLTEKNFRSNLVADKTNRDQVLDHLGTPALVSQYPNIGEEVWTYHYKEATTDMVNDVHFDAASGVMKAYSLRPDATVECH